MTHVEQLITAGLAVSAKAWTALGVVGFAVTDVSNPVIVAGGVAAALLAIVALFTKAYRGLTSWTAINIRRDRMLAQFEGKPGTAGVMDEIKSLHVGQADILLAVNDLKRSVGELRRTADQRRAGDVP